MWTTREVPVFYIINAGIKKIKVRFMTGECYYPFNFIDTQSHPFVSYCLWLEFLTTAKVSSGDAEPRVLAKY